MAYKHGTYANLLGSKAGAYAKKKGFASSGAGGTSTAGKKAWLGSCIVGKLILGKG